MEKEMFEKYFSKERMQRYLVACNNDYERAICLYKENMRVSQSLHPMIGIVEVVIRNRIHEVIKEHFGNEDWILEEREGFMQTLSTLSDKRHRSYLLHKVNAIESRLLKGNKAITSHAMISETSLGFWTEFYKSSVYKMLKGKPIQVFRKLPRGVGRHEISYMVEKVRKIRNRMNHQEPICFRGAEISYAEVMEVDRIMRQILEWIDPVLNEYSFEFVLRNQELAVVQERD